MANDDLDLTVGDPSAGDDAPRRRRGRPRKDESSASSASEVTDSELRSQLGRAFDGIIKNREARGDEELSEALREEQDAMTEGFVTMTNNVKVIRMPVIIGLNLVIVLGAFGRVGGILARRWSERRERRAMEVAAQSPEAEPYTEYGVN